MIEIVTPGLSTTVQDTRERLGTAELGVNVGGALDRRSAVTANLLVGNAPEAAVLEAAYVGPSFVVHARTALAVTGGSVDVTVNGEPREAWTTVELRPGDVVGLGPCRDAPRVYLALRGGVDVPVVHGSRSTNLLGRFGGLAGSALTKGSHVPLGPADGRAVAWTVPVEHRLAARRRDALDVVPVEPDDRLTQEGLDTFFSTDWSVTPASDRTGVRLAGPALSWRPRPQQLGAGPDLSNTVDGGYPLGSIHVPGGSGPILLHRDGPTMGGYAVIGVVARADLDLAAQNMPRSSVRFRRVTRPEALARWDEYRAGLSSLPSLLVRA